MYKLSLLGATELVMNTFFGRNLSGTWTKKKGGQVVNEHIFTEEQQENSNLPLYFKQLSIPTLRQWVSPSSIPHKNSTSLEESPLNPKVNRY